MDEKLLDEQRKSKLGGRDGRSQNQRGNYESGNLLIQRRVKPIGSI